MNISIVDPVEVNQWDELILNYPEYSFFHTSTWTKLLQETYKFKPHYLMAKEYGNVKAILPLMEVNSIFTGRRAISLPFSDFCEPLVSRGVSLKRIRHKMIDYCKEKKFNSLELRDGEVHLDNSIITPAGYQHIWIWHLVKNNFLKASLIIPGEILKKQSETRFLLKLAILLLLWKIFII